MGGNGGFPGAGEEAFDAEEWASSCGFGVAVDAEQGGEVLKRAPDGKAPGRGPGDLGDRQRGFDEGPDRGSCAGRGRPWPDQRADQRARRRRCLNRNGRRSERTSSARPGWFFPSPEQPTMTKTAGGGAVA